MQIHCVVKPLSRIDSIKINADNYFRIKIKAPPVDGKANEYLIAYLSRVFDLPKKHIQIISGYNSSHKRINIVAEESHMQNIIAQLKK